jgi:heptosyltransferase-2
VSNPTPPRILLVRFSSIGDLLLTTPLLRVLRRRYPDADLTFVTRADMADTLRDNPHLTRLVTWPREGSLRALARDLRQTPWTHRLDLHGSLRSRALRLLVGGRWHGYSKHRVRRQLLVTTHGRLGGRIAPVADRYFDAASALDVLPDGAPAEYFVTDIAAGQATRFLADHHLASGRPLLALAPGAAHFTKRWPTDHWLALAARMAATHDIVVLGGPAEREVAVRIVAAAGPRAASAAGTVSLSGTAALLQRATAVVVGDTGILHLATAVGTPVVGLYGPTVEAFGFFPYHAHAVAVQHPLACRPCSSRGGAACPLGHHHCLVQILPAEVTDALASLTATNPA